MSKRIYFISNFYFLISIFVLKGYAQELNCRISIKSDVIQSSDRQVFTTLQNSIHEFLNNRKWTSDIYSVTERISCNITITITDKPSINQYKSTVQIQSDRPVYGTAYNSVLFNYVDNDWDFEYTEFQPLEFSENTRSSSITSLLAFYAYVIIGMDYDSYSKMGGNPYFLKAQSLVSLQQNAAEKGWKAYENTKNRYWLIENLLNKSFQPLRESNYLFHRKALDEFIGNEEMARSVVIDCLQKVKKVHYEKPGSVLVRLFFDSKSQELADIFTKANPQDKQLVTNLLNDIDPTNNPKYEKIIKGN